MQREELVSKIREIIGTNIACGIEIFACLKQGDGFGIEKMIVMEPVKDEVKVLVAAAIEKQYLNDEIEYDEALNISDNKKAIYLLKQDENYCPFTNLNKQAKKSMGFKDDKLDQVIGFLFKLNLNSNGMFAYQNAFAGTKIKAKKGLRIIRNRKEDRFQIFKENLIKFDERLEFLVVEEIVLIKNVKVLQSRFEFDGYIRTAAKKTLAAIESLAIVSDMDKIKECADEESLTYAKKLLKIKNSPVLKMDRQVLLEKLSEIPRYMSMIKIEEGKIKTSTKKDANMLLKMLNDDYVKSILTDQEYDSPSKVILEGSV